MSDGVSWFKENADNLIGFSFYVNENIEIKLNTKYTVSYGDNKIHNYPGEIYRTKPEAEKAAKLYIKKEIKNQLSLVKELRLKLKMFK